jgi:hypothetical protein
MPKNAFGIETDPETKGGPSWLEDPFPEDQTTESRADAATEGPPAEPTAPEVTPEPTTDEPSVAPTPDGDLLIQVSPEELEALKAAQTIKLEEESAAAADPAAQPVEGETPAEAEARLYANKYRSVEDLEKGYSERSDMWRRALESQRAAEAERDRAAAVAEQYEAALRSAVPLMEQAARREAQVRTWAEQVRSETGYYPQGYEPPAPGQGPPAGANPADVQRLVREQVAAERAAWEEQSERQRQAAALEATVNQFYSDNPNVEPYGALDNEITDAMAELNYSPQWGQVRNPDGSYGVIVDPTDRGSLDVLFEAASRPALLEVLKVRPEYFTSEAGLQLARRDAAILEGVPAITEPQVATVPASRAGSRAGQRVPFAESAAGSTPADQAPDENDVWERIKAVDAKPKAGSKVPIFFE